VTSTLDANNGTWCKVNSVSSTVWVHQTTYSNGGNWSFTNSTADKSATVPGTCAPQLDYDSVNYVCMNNNALVTGYSGSDSDLRANALRNITTFLSNKGSGLMAECASLGTLENSGDSSNVATAVVPHLMYDNGSTATDDGITKNKLPNGWFTNSSAHNCTDPDYTSGYCTYFSAPSDPFAQIGDYALSPETGAIQDWHAAKSTGASPDRPKIKPGVKRIAYSFKDWTVSSDVNLPWDGAGDGEDMITFAQKDNDPNKGAVIYVGGHSLTDVTAGTRVILNTLLNLGSDPISADRGIAAPIGYKDPNGSGILNVAVPAFYAVTGYPASVDSYAFATASQWVYPYVPGDLRSYTLQGSGALTEGNNNYTNGVTWSTNLSPPGSTNGNTPFARNLFTYFGGQKTASANVRNGYQQLGWVPESISPLVLNNTYPASQTATPNSGTNSDTGGTGNTCVDVMGWKPNGANIDPVFQNTPDGICDLQQALEYTPVTSALPFLTEKTALQNEFRGVQQMLNKVRGFCVSSTSSGGVHIDGASAVNFKFVPLQADCNNPDESNRAKMGGIVDSTPAIIGPSANVPGGAKRPTVAYVGGWDGQLHAFYVGSSGATYANPDPWTPSHTSGTAYHLPNAYAGEIATHAGSQWNTAMESTTPTLGTELWSFLPAT
jgi:type IV pilus assembly protein PilY1